ncbi:MAG: dihydrolipoyl dehydrogenase [Treponema sp.]|jgi:dihydrolipoamide dehydrogenase|nr:dihydrolipoyl dehydrogenase [Treponema sp.]
MNTTVLTDCGKTMYDLVILGAGPAGYPAAFRAAAKGKKVAVIEKDAVGGVCLNSGCIPTKTLLYSSGLFRKLHTTAGILCTNAEMDMNALQERRREVILQLQQGILTRMQKYGIALFYAEAEVTSENSVLIHLQESGTAITLHAGHILVTGGSTPAVLPVPGFDDPSVMTSSTILEKQTVFKDLIIVGGGVIGVEFAQFYSDLGVPVTILEAAPHILPQMDIDIARNLTAILTKRGVTVKCGVMVQKAVKAADGKFTVFYSGGAADSVTAEGLLCAAGRKCHAERIFSEDFVSCIKICKGMISVDANSETSVKGIYAAGDITGGLQLAHKATAEGLHAVDAMFPDPDLTEGMNSSCSGDLSLVPSCVYTDPEIACVGISPEAEKKNRTELRTLKSLMSTNGKSVLEGAERGFIKLLVDRKTERLLGARLMCTHATDILPLLELAIKQKMTTRELSSIIYAHPTIAEAVGAAAGC